GRRQNRRTLLHVLRATGALGFDRRAGIHASTFTKRNSSFIIRSGSIIFQNGVGSMVQRHFGCHPAMGDDRQPVAVTSGT
ncbi:MAG TPA: hypothetical protein VN043_17360, partial [Rhodanobacter sp.]|nr:hypothetical protein [Rhodanobacter sp.]